MVKFAVSNEEIFYRMDALLEELEHIVRTEGIHARGGLPKNALVIMFTLGLISGERLEQISRELHTADMEFQVAATGDVTAARHE